MNDNEVKRTERGWAGHCIISNDCRYHRNTLLEYKDLKIVVSTIGRYIPKNRVMNGDYSFDTVGLDRFFETMAFVADKTKYHDADASQQVEFNSKWFLNDPDMEIEADEMHENVIKEISEKMKKNELIIVQY